MVNNDGYGKAKIKTKWVQLDSPELTLRYGVLNTNLPSWDLRIEACCAPHPVPYMFIDSICVPGGIPIMMS
jgi:hypothetical protein